MRKVLPFIIVGAVGIATLTSATLLYRAKRPPTLKLTADRPAGDKPGESVHIRGRVDAPVTLEEYGDFQCPPCGKLAGPIKDLEKDYGNSLRVIFHNFPLITHQHATKAACAAEAAGLQGKFWEMHDAIYSEQERWSKAADVQPLFNAYAGLIGLDVKRFQEDVNSDKIKERVSADQRHGSSLGIQTTPTIFLNNRAVDPADLAPDRLRKLVDAAVKEAALGKTSPVASPSSK